VAPVNDFVKIILHVIYRLSFIVYAGCAFPQLLVLSASGCAFPHLPVLFRIWLCFSASAYLISKHHANFYNHIEINAKKGLDSLLNQILFRCI